MFDYQKTADACVKCGRCIPDCTIYSISGDETRSPRGFIDLLGQYQQNRLPLNEQTKDIFESCFLCTHCVSVCPKSLPTDELIEEIRIDIAKKFGIKWYKRFFFYLLKNRSLMNALFKASAFFTPLFFKSTQEGIVGRFPLPFIQKRLLPPTPRQTFLEKYPEIIKAKNAKQKVAIFIGCLSNYNYVQVGDSLLKILAHLQIDTFLAKEQKCCGAPAHFTGDSQSVQNLMEHNITYFEKIIQEVDAVLIPEATCAAMILHDYQRIAKNDEVMTQRIQNLIPHFFMASDWLFRYTNLAEILATKPKQNLQITYHDPCHARKVLQIYKEPRALISQNYTLKEMSNPNACCGFGGITMQTEKHHYASKVGQSKAHMIQQTQANIVSAECNACRMQLSNAMRQEGVNVHFAHPLELIAQALQTEKA
ncbi:glycerol-3-phosphate dehydrogenase [Helicobacter monodelphidis]|uniref:(Fe-S)-binding protein n=1 Tax=Helicobacter sp. 15-1451 TaxID=2004995 RepID=UPI000DCC49FB|nr:(Fe-S)-binding protein [Helicobacter sp. 15-1451]RAX58199.1 glycerol-3-phosphate dehydrogenase [Helicobacter sp. 15-1451]